MHHVVNVTEEQAAAAIADREPYVLVFLLRPSAEAGAAGEGEHAVQGAALSWSEWWLFWPMTALGT